MYYSANVLARIITKFAEEEFGTIGMSPSHAFLLMTINDKPGIRPMEISEIMMLSPSTITRFIEKMENKEYVWRKTVGKFIEVYPTDKCLSVNTKLHKAWKNLYNRYTHILGESHARLLTMTIYEAAKKLERK